MELCFGSVGWLFFRFKMSILQYVYGGGDGGQSLESGFSFFSFFFLSLFFTSLRGFGFKKYCIVQKHSFVFSI